MIIATWVSLLFGTIIGGSAGGFDMAKVSGANQLAGFGCSIASIVSQALVLALEWVSVKAEAKPLTASSPV